MLRLSSDTHLLQTSFTINQIMDVMKKSIIGSIAIKNSLKNVLDGNGPVISMSVKKQSIDKKVSDDEPTLSTG